MRRLFVPHVLVFSLVTLTAGCNSNTSTPTPITPTLNPVNEPPFTGSLNPNGGVTYPFATITAGIVTATLTSIDPDPDATAIIGLSLGTWNGTACQIILADDAAVVGRSVIGQVAGPGSVCARVYDVGKLTETVTFTVNIAHF